MKSTMDPALFGDLDEGEGSETLNEARPLSTSPPLVGRDSEFGALRDGLEEAIAGRASLFLITGEAGMGKSRLVEELATLARSNGVRVLLGRCWEAVDAPAYWLWIQVLRQLCAELDDGALRAATGGATEIAHLVPQVGERLGMTSVPDTPTLDSRFGLFDAVASFMYNSAESQPTMLVLEDLHAADESSLLLLKFLARQNPRSHLLIVGTYDDIAGRGKPGNERILSETAREGRHLSLRALDEDAVKSMYADSSGQLPSDAIARAVHAASEGNPLFIDEAIRMLATKGDIHRPDYSMGFRVPEGARGIIRSRLEGLGDEVAELLSVASVIGREFGLTLLQQVVDIEMEALLEILSQAVSAEVVSETSALGRYAFTHILIRETLYEDLTAAKRMRLHRTVAETLEASYASSLESRLPELAHHWFKSAQAGDAAKTMRYAVQAADQAMAHHAYEEAVRLYQRALKVSEAAGADADQVARIRAGIAHGRHTLEPSAQASAGEATTGVFAREGDYWTISYSGSETRLKDIKGLRYIAQLLKVPGREVHVLDLATSVEGALPQPRGRGVEHDELSSDGLGDAGVILDATAKAAYKQRLVDLREDLEEAEGFNDPERAARAREEMDALVSQLAGGVGLGGRDRKAASQAEKARVNITKSVKDALKRIEEHHGHLGDHLRATIRTGTYCAYVPDPRMPISWRTEP
jgi:energy-coupling factor transporter ATP-binding protein EcfA2